MRRTGKQRQNRGEIEDEETREREEGEGRVEGEIKERTFALVVRDEVALDRALSAGRGVKEEATTGLHARVGRGGGLTSTEEEKVADNEIGRDPN